MLRMTLSFEANKSCLLSLGLRGQTFPSGFVLELNNDKTLHSNSKLSSSQSIIYHTFSINGIFMQGMGGPNHIYPTACP